jgi:hypothetical protein
MSEKDSGVYFKGERPAPTETTKTKEKEPKPKK